MTAIRKTKRKGKRELYFDEAQSLFLAGKELEGIGELLPVALQTLKRWHRKASGRTKDARCRFHPGGWERP